VSALFKLKFKVGPGPETVKRVAAGATRAAQAAGVVAGSTSAAVAGGVVVGVVAVAAVTVAVAEVVDWAREEGIRRAKLIAVRDGFASRLAFEVMGRKQDADLKLRIAEWDTFDDARVRAAASAGYARANAELARLAEPERQGLIEALQERYGADAFIPVQRRLFVALGGYDKEPDTFDIDLGTLRR
jgi:hypothetical protein